MAAAKKIPGMSRYGECRDRAVAESLVATLQMGLNQLPVFK
ncbi:MAG: hypothetical protein SH820_08055 [Xanthomonadales bacterium]|nr:hypothetical protein [Xanthomonadales bacterium]